MKTMLQLQGLFYILTGVWPLLSIRTFQMVTGPKHDKWLVKTLGVMITCSGIVFLIGSQAESPPHEVIVLAVLNCLALAMVDVNYAWKKIISKVYLLDAVVELGMVLVYGILWLK